MTDVRLVFPMVALVLLTVMVALVMVRRRFAAARAGEVKISNFKVNQFDEGVPERMLQAGRNYVNLFEMPVLFYAVCATALATNLVDTVLLGLAWFYVAARYVHSYIHLTHNHIMWRLRVFASSLITVVVMWVWLALKAAGVAG